MIALPAVPLLALCLGAAAPRPTVAVTWFENNTGNESYDALGRGLADMLITDLGRLEALQVVERSRLNELLKEIELGKSAFIDPATAAKMGKGLGATFVLTGSFASIEPTMRLDARLVEVATSKVVFSADSSGPTADFFALEKELALKLVEGLGVKLTARENASLGRVATESFPAFQAWSAGLVALDRGEVEAAKSALERALAEDSGFSAARDALASLEARLKALKAEHDKMMAKDASELLRQLALIRKEPARVKEVPSLIDVVGINASLPAGAAAARDVATAILDMKLSEQLELDVAGMRMPLNAWALQLQVMASYYLRMHSDVVTYGEAFLRRYPKSSYYAVVQSFVNISMTALNQVEAGRKELAKIYERDKRHRQERQCRLVRPRAAQIQACLAYLDLMARAPANERKDALDGLLSAARRRGAAPPLARIRSAFVAAKADDASMRELEKLEQEFASRQEAAERELVELLSPDCTSQPLLDKRLAGCHAWVEKAKPKGGALLQAAVAALLRELQSNPHQQEAVKRELAFVQALPLDAEQQKELARTRQIITERRDEAAKRLADARKRSNALDRAYDAALPEVAAVAQELFAKAPADTAAAEVLVRLALDRGDVAAARAVESRFLAAAKPTAYNPLKELIERHEREVNDYERATATAMRDAAQALGFAGRRAEAESILAQAFKRWPTDARMRALSVDLALDLDDSAGGAAALAAWVKADPAFTKTDPYMSLTRRLQQYEEDKRAVAEIEPEAMRQLGYELTRTAQHREAAVLFLRLAREYPTFKMSDAAQSLQVAASSFTEAGERQRARELYEEIITRFPDTPAATAARLLVQQLPR